MVRMEMYQMPEYNNIQSEKANDIGFIIWSLVHNFIRNQSVNFHVSDTLDFTSSVIHIRKYFHFHICHI
jgi:hypothetical protein